MFKKTHLYVILLIIAVALIISGICIQNEELKAIKGVLLGLGAGLLGSNIANIYMAYYYKKNPEVMKQNKIELTDERNTYIRYRAKAKSGDIVQWIIMIIAFITILIDTSIWLTLGLVVVYLLYTILQVYFVAKYSKEM